MEKLRRRWLVALAALTLGATAWGRPLIERTEDLLDWDRNPALEVDGGAVRLSLSPERPHDKMRCVERTFPARLLAGKTYRLEFELRGENITKGAKPWYSVKVMFSFTDGKGETHYIDAGGQLGTFDWRRVERDVSFPADLASSVRLSIGFQEVTGTIWLRRLRLAELGWPVSIASAANMAFEDETEGDGKGGWSDQGPDQDGRTLKAAIRQRLAQQGVKSLNGLPFAPQLDGKGVITLKSQRFPNGPETATVTLPQPQRARHLLVLHGACWLPATAKGDLGSIEVRDSQGHQQTIAVRANVDVADWWNPRTLENGGVAIRAKLTGGNSVGLYGSTFPLNSELADVASVTFRSLNGSPIWMVTGLALAMEPPELPKDRPVVITASDDWRAVSFPPRNVRTAGSALDVSPWYPFRGKSGDLGRLIINAQGRFAFETAPDRPVRFYANSISGGELDACKDHEGVRLFCQEMRKAGFNMIRTHFLDSWLMGGAPGERQFNPQRLDLFDYLVSQLKENGIYLNFDCMTGFLGYTTGKNAWSARLTDECFKGRMLFDQNIRDNWRWGVETLLTHVNPYTKTRLVDEPLLAMTHGYNEQEFAFMRPLKPELATPAYRDFLKRHYQGDLAAFNREANTAYASFDDVPMFEPGKEQSRPARLFMRETELAMIRWYRQQLDELGFKGPTTNYNMLKDQHYNALRRHCDYVSSNSYHDHPWGGNGALNIISQSSSLGGAAPHYRGAISTRQLGKPFVVTEYASVWWNQYRHDHSFSFASYAALQDIDVLTSHAGSVSVRDLNDNPRKLASFCIFNDPVRVAAEYLGFFMFMRGDVRPADSRVRIAVDTSTIYDSPAAVSPLSSQQNRLALLTGFALECFDKPEDLTPLGQRELRLTRSGGSSVVTDLAGFSQLVDAKQTSSEQLVKLLKDRGLLPADNASDGISRFESATGELLLDTKRNFMRINTPRLQGFCAEAKTTAKANDFSLDQLDERGCVAAVAIDGLKPLRQARRITIVYATDALNNRMTFQDEERKTVSRYGDMPILLKMGRFTATLKSDHADALKLYALDLAGNRTREITTVKRSPGQLQFSIDTHRDGTTVFFELAAE